MDTTGHLKVAATEANVAVRAVEALRAALGERLVAIVLFGSRARGDSTADSDWDLLVIAEGLPERTLERHFYLCIRNDGYSASLEERKIYRLITDRNADAHNLVRVVDESGEDYLYPAGWFGSISVPRAAIKELALAN